MYHMLHKQYYGNHSKHKMTTDKQYDILKTNMASFIQNNEESLRTNGTLKYKQDDLHWSELTKKLNKFGPPHRTMQQWKKVWCDFKRAEKKRKAKLKAQPVKKSISNHDNEISEGDIEDSHLETATSSTSDMHIKYENLDNEQNSQSMYSTYSNEYDNDYSYPDEDSLRESYEDEKIFIPDESSCGTYNYPSHFFSGATTAERKADQPTLKTHFPSPPPLQPANVPMFTQTLYTLQNQMEHQTKLLEHLSQMSSTMINLMERQVDTAEKQTEAIHRQALATERHASVMNKFLRMVQEKMVKENSQKTISTENVSNHIL